MEGFRKLEQKIPIIKVGTSVAENLRFIEKQKVWQKKREEIDKIVDAAGHSIDERIKDAVTAANLMELNTEQSCEGHLDRGVPWPFLEIAAPDQPKWSFVGEEENFEQVAREMGVSEEDLSREWSTWEPGKINDVRMEAGRRLREKLRKDPLPLTEETKTWRDKNILLYKRAKDLLTEFYSNAQGEELKNRLIIRGKEGADFRIQPETGLDPVTESDYAKTQREKYGSPVWNLPEDERKVLEEKLTGRRNEISRFTEFLKKKYFSG